MKQLAIFDLDGTLLNTLDDLANAGNHLLERYGYPTHPVDAYRYFVGNGILKLVERIVPEEYRGDAARLERLRDEFNAYYKQHNVERTAPYAGVLELLDGLREQGMTLAVLSNKPHPFTRALCERFFGDRFALAHGQREGYPAKPDRRLVGEILELTGTAAEDCVYIGDSGVDMRTAKNGGVYAVGALWGFRDRAELLENGADALAQRPGDLLRMVD